MYVGPWQEYRLGQLFNEQNRLLADAIRQQIQQQIREEQTLKPQVQLRGQQKPPLSYSASLRQSQTPQSHHSIPPTTASNRSIRSDASSTSQLSLRTPHSHSNSITQLDTPKSYSSTSSSASSLLPPLQAAARDAVNRLQQARYRATAGHPLVHIVNTYCPDVCSGESTPQASDRPSSRVGSFHPDTRPIYAGGGGGGGGLVAPAGLARRRRKPPTHTRDTSKGVSAHREHITRMRSLYGLQSNGQLNKPLDDTASEEHARSTPNGVHTAAPSHQAYAAEASHGTSSSHSSSPVPPAAGVSLPPINHHATHPYPPHPSASPSSPSHIGSSSYVSPSLALRGIVPSGPNLPGAPLPLLTHQSIALYGQLPNHVQSSLRFYAATGDSRGGANIPIEVVNDQPTHTAANATYDTYAAGRIQTNGATTQTHAPAPNDLITTDMLMNSHASMSPQLQSLSHASGVDSVRSDSTTTGGVPSSLTGSGDWLSGLKGSPAVNIPIRPSSNLSRPIIDLHQYGASTYERRVILASPTPPMDAQETTTAAAPSPINIEHAQQVLQPQQQHPLPPLSLSSSPSHAGLLSGHVGARGHPSNSLQASTSKLSAEARLMAGYDSTHFPPTVATRDLHSSSGWSESGDFENEVNDLLGWTENVVAEQQRFTPKHVQFTKIHT